MVYFCFIFIFFFTCLWNCYFLPGGFYLGCSDQNGLKLLIMSVFFLREASFSLVGSWCFFFCGHSDDIPLSKELGLYYLPFTATKSFLYMAWRFFFFFLI